MSHHKSSYRPSVMSHQFGQVPRADIPRSHFSRTHGYKTTFDAGYLVPFYCDEVYPGDTFKLKATMFARLNTPIFPVMDNLFLETFFFFVPNRLLWDNWQKFCGERKNPDDSIDYVVPYIQAPDTTGWTYASLFDYFGLPTGVPKIRCDAFWHRAYNLIWNEWFRDENIQDSVVVDTDDGPDTNSDYVLLRRGKRHDYFTSCLPWPQKGPGVELPLGSYADVTMVDHVTAGNKAAKIVKATDDTLFNSQQALYHDASSYFQNADGVNLVKLDPNGTLRVDLSDASAATINSLRQAFQVQKLLERDARGGTRYTEILQSHFGVYSPDQRLQRPEFLGGGHSRINFGTVPQTSSTDATTPQGNLAAYAVGAGTHNGFVKSFVEHGVIIGLCNVRADITYQQGINRMFSRRTRYDYYWPAFSHLGEQAVLNQEIYAVEAVYDGEGNDTSSNSGVFGYQERWAELRYKPSLITGKMRSTDAQSLDAWHLSQEFSSLPELTSVDFIQDNPPIDRIVAVPSEPDFKLDCFIEMHTARPLPVYSVPGLIDHF